MPDLWAELLSYGDPESEDRMLCAWVLELVRQGRAHEALRRAEGRTGEMVGSVMALVLQRAGHDERAAAALPEIPDPVAQRELSLYVLSTRYRVTRNSRDLEALCSVNAEGSRVLASFVPVSELPRDRPDLSVHHALRDVLAVGWKEAVALRQEELPLLELRMLGGFEVRVLGQPVALTGRPRDILLMTALGLSRERIAETLWPGVGAEKSRNNLHVNLNQLRKVIEPWGIATYLFEDGLRRCRCDLWTVQAAVEAGDWPQVRQLYRSPSSDPDLHPVLEVHAALEGQVLAGVLRHSSKLTPLEAQDWLEWALAADPLHEGTMEALLKVLLSSGKRITAHRYYQEYASRLRVNLNLTPSQKLQRLLASV